METKDNAELCLKWQNFKENFMSHFGNLKNEEEFVDVTLSCGGQHLRAHKVVLSASSPYLKSLFKENPCKHPVVILDCVEFRQLEALLTFVYTGQVSVSESDLQSFLDSATLLQIRGLSETSDNDSVATPTKRPQTEAPEECTPPKRVAPRRASRSNISEAKKEESLSEGEMEPLRASADWEQRDSDSTMDGRRRHSLDPRPCQVCGRVYSNLSNLRQHMRLIHNPTLVTCHLCSKTFKTDLYLRRHLMSYHDMIGEESGGLTWRGKLPPTHVIQRNALQTSSGFPPPPDAMTESLPR